ncbi:hypothetical protein [Herbiconiux ginsengi]|uniref:Osmotically inducible lipoprotein OsmE n=1 Tax=Herbiconiux ginsengi TaxID=381665 RepID=A0A1H3TYE3_9MICO|nr:hypothetical protein [Herbiconiux ginsengi]SDZ55264.1 osmotically inducible lipoprotein OsmE [Herbiconiux ginsengi]
MQRVLTATTTLVVTAGLLTGCALLDRHSQLTIAMLMDDEGYTVDVTTNPVDITDTVCGDDLKCVEAYSTDEANYYRFTSRDAAASYAASVDDGFAVHYIAMDFTGKNNVSTDAQRSAMERLAGTWQDYDGPFPDR